ncbi:MAG: toprim domain-containing protein, partial [Flavobacteriaceae bacterium]|nr:toprim domain-containing protein [Flavobacteriaceae bacterium]
MSQNLVIVESPAKAKTIEKFLGKDFKVMSSYGHITDLPVKELGVDVENDFRPNYKVSSDKKAVVKKLKEAADASKLVWLARMVEGNMNDGGSRRGLGIPVWQENSFFSGIIRVWSLLFI